MKFFFLAFLSFINVACAQGSMSGDGSKQHLTIRPGEIRWVEFPLPKGDIQFTCKGVPVRFAKKNERGHAFVIETYFSDLQPYTCKVQSDDKLSTEIHFTVEPKEYLAEKLKVEPGKIKLSAKNQKRADREQLVLNQVYNSSLPDFLFHEAFIQPLNSLVTSVYGTKRVYNGVKQGQHLGTDYRAAIGDKVPAANAGKIVFAGDLFYTGWTVIIDHGLDIFTVYGHLSKTLMNAGEMVKRGETIGLSGNTGRTSGPHLHWGVKIQGQYIDGIALIEESKKHFSK